MEMDYWWVKLFIDLLKEAAWPIFFLILLLKIVPRYKTEIYDVAKFFASLIQKRGLKTPYGEIPPETDLPGSNKDDVTPATEGTEVRYEKARKIAKEIVKKREEVSEPIVILGFYISEREGDVPLIDQNMMVVDYQPDYKDIDGIRYPIGQKIEFTIINFSDKDLEFPYVAVQFPTIFKHLDTEHPERGVRKTNSNLWGMGGRLTQWREISSGTIEMSSIPKRSLAPGEGVRFFIRFDLPNETREYNLKMICKAQNWPEEVSKDLTLSVRERILVS